MTVYWLKVIYSHGVCKSWILWCPFSRCLLGCPNLFLNEIWAACLNSECPAHALWVRENSFICFYLRCTGVLLTFHFNPIFSKSTEGLLKPGLRFAYWIIVLLDGMESSFKGPFLDTWLETVRKWLLKCRCRLVGPH